MFKGFVSEGSTVEIAFRADHSNSGPTGFFFGYVPRGGSSGHEDAQFKPVAPGGSHTVESTVPSASDVWSVKIRIDVPDDAGSGRLIVKSGGKELDNSVVQKDETWTYSVNPSS